MQHIGRHLYDFSLVVGPDKTACLQSFVTYLEMQALGCHSTILSASLTRSTRSADSNFFVRERRERKATTCPAWARDGARLA